MTAAEMPRLAFDRDAGNYAQARPGYPEKLYELLVARCGLAPGLRVLEIGAGSGLATGRILRAGARMVLVEPGVKFAALLADQFGGQPVEIVVSDFESAPLDGTFDLAVAATSFHWLNLPIALPRLAALIRPGGWLAVWWSIFQDPARPTPFRSALDDLYAEVLPELKKPSDGFPDRLRPESWTRELEAGGLFGPVETHFIPFENPLTAQRARRLWATFSNIIALPEQRRQDFLDRLAAIVEDQFGGLVYDPCVTAAYLAARRVDVQ